MYMNEFLFNFLSFIMLVVFVLVGVAFLTLLERKVLGYIQIRKGPNKVGYLGILQPFSDAIKLFSKEQMFPLMSNFLIYYYCPVFMLFLSLFIWVLIPYMIGLVMFNLGILFLLCCLGLSVYMVMFSGWSSNSSYSLLGSLRSVAQTISYEVSMALIMISSLVMIFSLNMIDFEIYQKLIWMLLLMFPLSLIFMISCLAEVNRTPFDFAEGESELVSGFNVEYSGGGFALIFMAEYSMILFMSLLFVIMYLGSGLGSLMFYFKLILISFFYLWVRGTLPRFRYDKLMYLAWKIFLPISLNFLLFYFSLKIFMMVIVI
uniref:NADH-ubiquinone oxidoreductase chain 1 n=1 Tax=Noterus clavicornis BMNH1425090 TaxID=2558029 RepID=A0A191ZRU3_9COLE|nr:NADH dehydrogenase subunit 1 [Noterus clavicornis BMNH1425090]UPX88472.1 NADH dehydrogenase subunit 1 [Noterus clavicornis]